MHTLARVQSTVKCCLLFTVDTNGGHFDNKEYIKSYSQTYNQYTDTLAVLLVLGARSDNSDYSAVSIISHSIFLTAKLISSSLAQIFVWIILRQIIAKLEESVSSFPGKPEDLKQAF